MLQIASRWQDESTIKLPLHHHPPLTGWTMQTAVISSHPAIIDLTGNSADSGGKRGSMGVLRILRLCVRARQDSSQVSTKQACERQIRGNVVVLISNHPAVVMGHGWNKNR